MQAAFPIVVFGAVGLSVVMSIVFLFSKGSMYDEIGSGGLPGEGETPGMGMGMGSPYGAAASDYDSIARSPELQRAEREQEIRQMVQARSERRVRRGEPALDVDADGAPLTAAPPGGALRHTAIAEGDRPLGAAHMHRPKRRGLEPLDLEAEVARTLAE